MILNQIFDALNIGIVILDRDLKVHKWNRWMEIHSDISADEIIGKSILNVFPDLNNKRFIRSYKSVFAFGNLSFFSQKLHHYLFPFKSTSYSGAEFDYMQQSCAMGPLRDENKEIKYLYIYVQDVTEVAVYEQKLLEMNMKDGMTGVYNRRFLETKIVEEFERHKRYKADFSLIMFDIDHFKKVNDVYGHQCGDFILKSVSSRIASIIRNVDFLIRYGGEEFCCLLPHTPMKFAAKVAERFRKVVMEQEHNFDGQDIKVTISLGVAELRESITSVEEMLKKADEALYKAKGEGRNRVVAMNEQS
jgi:diguanylate cyclase (GGDEF)-like protein/PAS domain S-box-containing protein